MAVMVPETQTIEVDQATAETLGHLAQGRGVTVAQLVAELVPVAADAEAVAELGRRWSAIEAGAATVSNDDVARWLETWGTPDFRPWPRA